jgi:ectoine hydroxylase-related dioxygenase (phytanoyl-CoA dioxygenase family)
MLNTKVYPRIMQNEKLEQKLNEDGYIVIKNFLSPEALQDLIDYNKNNQPEFNAEHIINSVWHTRDEDYKIRTIRKIIDVYTPFCDKYFVDYKIFGGSFVIKPSGGKGASQPHIDYGIVDEDKFRSFNLWIPLVKLTKENGALQVMKGSHKIRNVFRGPNIPDVTADIREYLWNSSDYLFINAGDAVLYDHRAIHCSRNNFSSIARVATSCALTSSAAHMMAYFMNNEQTKVLGFEIETDYLMKNNHANIPNQFAPVKEWDWTVKQLSIDELNEAGSTNIFKKFLRKLAA